MNYDTITATTFTATARATDAYTAAQDWIANQAVDMALERLHTLEQVLKLDSNQGTKTDATN